MNDKNAAAEAVFFCRPLCAYTGADNDLKRSERRDSTAHSSRRRPQLIQMISALAAHHQDEPTISLEELDRDVFASNPWITVFVAQIGNVVVGYVALCPLMLLHFGLRGLEISHLFVEDHVRGQLSRTTNILKNGFEADLPTGPRFRRLIGSNE